MLQLKEAIDADDLAQVQALMMNNPALHAAPIGYAKNGPLTWAAECRYQPPTEARLAIAKWMLDNGSDVHQGGDGPLMRAALNRDRIPMMELLVAHGANVNAAWNGDFPILFAACETVNPVSMKWLLAHGAQPGAALDYLIAGYVRSDEFRECVELLIGAGAKTKYDLPGVLDLLRGRPVDPALVHRHYPELDCGSTGSRRLLLTGGTLLHVAAEFGLAAEASQLLDHGADVDAPGGSGQTPLFHAVSQFDDWGLEVSQILLDRGASLTIRATLPGDYDKPADFVESCTPLGYAMRFPGGDTGTVRLLRDRGGKE